MILHRGIRTYTTVQTDIATDPSKIYHLRWNPTAGFTLKDLADAGYNPTTAPETNAAFDSAYDDMLVARIMTNSSNLPAITNLINKNILRTQVVTTDFGFPATGNGATTSVAFPALNWGRACTPVITWDKKSFNQNLTGSKDYDEAITATVTRYGVSASVMLDFGDQGNNVLRLTALA